MLTVWYIWRMRQTRLAWRGRDLTGSCIFTSSLLSTTILHLTTSASRHIDSQLCWCSYSSNGNRSLSFYNNDRRDWSVDIENLLYRDEEYFGCIISNRKPIPGEPGTLLQGELECLMSLLRRRLDNRDDKGQSRETQRTLAPAVGVQTCTAPWTLYTSDFLGSTTLTSRSRPS